MFDKNAQSFTGELPEGSESVDVLVLAKDSQGNSGSTAFRIEVNENQNVAGEAPGSFAALTAYVLGAATEQTSC